jgi:Ca-activated chloride channel family protein
MRNIVPVYDFQNRTLVINCENLKFKTLTLKYTGIMFQFAHINLLFLLSVIPVIFILFWFSNRRKKKILREFGEREIIGELMPDVSASRPVIKLILLTLALAFFILGIAGPQFGTKLQETKRKGIEIIIALDVSNSMLAQDIQPSRLERAKQAISNLVDRLRNDKIGVIVFAGEAFTQLPITTDYVSAKMFLSTISPKIISVQGTAIGAAINLAAKSFSPETKSGKAIVVITDGENHEDDAVGAATTAATEKGISVYTVGIGLREGAPIPVIADNGQKTFLKDQQGNVVISKLDEEMLQKIAAAGKGIYVRATNTEAGLNTIFNEINKLNKATFEARTYAEYADQFQWPMAMALVLLLLELIIIERKSKWSDKFRLFKVK